MLGITELLTVGGKILDKVIPDPEAKARALLELQKLNQDGELARMANELAYAQGQMEINKAEAANANLFIAGWRPFVGWICAVAFGVQFIVAPFVAWISQIYGWNASMPDLNFEQLMGLLMGMLGLGAYRTFEKIKGK